MLGELPLKGKYITHLCHFIKTLSLGKVQTPALNSRKPPTAFQSIVCVLSRAWPNFPAWKPRHVLSPASSVQTNSQRVGRWWTSTGICLDCHSAPDMIKYSWLALDQTDYLTAPRKNTWCDLIPVSSKMLTNQPKASPYRPTFKIWRINLAASLIHFNGVDCNSLV